MENYHTDLHRHSTQTSRTFARDYFLRAGIAIETEAFWEVDGQLALRLSAANDRNTGKINITATPLSPVRDGGSLLLGTPIVEVVTLSIGLRDFQARALALGVNVPTQLWDDFTEIVRKLYACHLSADSLYTALDPLVLTNNDLWIAYGGVIEVDPNAYYRQPGAPLPQIPLPPERINYVPLNGDIVSVVNGAGLGMLTADAITRFGGVSAGMVDMSSGALLEKLAPALTFAASLPRVNIVVLNVFAGMTHCDDIARAVLRWNDDAPSVPLIVRMAGYDSEDGKEILDKAARVNLYTALDLDDAARRAVHLANERKVEHGYLGE